LSWLWKQGDSTTEEAKKKRNNENLPCEQVAWNLPEQFLSLLSFLSWL